MVKQNSFVFPENWDILPENPSETQINALKKLYLIARGSNNQGHKSISSHLNDYETPDMKDFLGHRNFTTYAEEEFNTFHAIYLGTISYFQSISTDTEINKRLKDGVPREYVRERDHLRNTFQQAIPELKALFGIELEPTYKPSPLNQELNRLLSEKSTLYLEEKTKALSGTYALYRYHASSDYIIRSEIQIYGETHQDRPAIRFTATYPLPRNRGHAEIVGDVLALKDYLYFIGFDTETRAPYMMVLEDSPKQWECGEVRGVFVRYGLINRVIAAKAVLISSTRTVAPNEPALADMSPAYIPLSDVDYDTFLSGVLAGFDPERPNVTWAIG